MSGFQRQPEYLVGLADRADRAERFRHALFLERIQKAGEALWPREDQWLKGYADSSEYLAMRGLYDDFGEAALR